MPGEMVDRAGKWAGLNNSSIVKFTGYYPRRPDVESEFLLVFSYVSGGHLADYLERERESLDYARRVKLRNILIGDDGHALLCDYDLDGLASGTTGTSLQPIETLRYKSPEELGTNLTVMSRSDIWSFASVFLTIITNQVPYGNVEMDGRKLAEAMSQRILPAEIDNLDCPIRAQNLLGVCWKWELEFRPTASEVVSILSGRTCRLTKAWSIPANKPACLRFSHSGEYLAVGYEGLIKVFKAESGNLVAELPLPKAKPFFLQISHSGRYLAASTWGNKIMLWDLATRKLKGEYKGHKNEIWGLDLAFDDSYIVSGAYDMTVRATVTAVNANSKWCLAIDGETNVWALDLQPNGMAPQTIGKIDGTRDPSRTDLSAVSEDGSGFVVSGSMNAKIMAVWKYVFWDTPGVYHH
ncbi:hypothetical protein FRB99_005334 [Tulasnella sp. 403]|nr:hypothetical protein FRB99_005334 [Tulasnella sp. 403]